MIIGVSGKIGSGKDTIARAAYYYISKFDESSIDIPNYESNYKVCSLGWETMKFADSLKDIVCILTGCTREELEDIDFKNSKLPDDWIYYGYADGFSRKYIGNGEMGPPIMNSKQCDKETYETHYRINWQTAYKAHLTYRELLQKLGTDLLRNQLHENVWVNALMSKYKKIADNWDNDGNTTVECYPNWIITDCRFPNELKAIKDKDGITIRVNRQIKGSSKFEGTQEEWKLLCERNNSSNHISETALDNSEFDYVINNNGTIEDLYLQVKELLLKLKIITR